ncbi:dihydrofolate reductase family protein [Nemorincola caseinilytica]|uniref:Dihydrofolate reductase family protein n=1 Tax=Nemorincola caseinilytica TaxID=2054315 RepID=A0ABP8NMN4_9BACT
MRKLIFGINLTLDGCCDHTKGDSNEEVHEYFTQLMQDSDTLLYGRKTYELMVPFWPDIAKNGSGSTKAMNDFATAFAAVNNMVVCSRTLDKVEGKNTSIIRGNLRDEVLKLKQQPGGNISTGGVDIPSQLIALGLVDEFHIVVQPIIAGAGRRILDTTNLEESLYLKLVGSKIFDSGHVALKYAKQ